MLNLFLNESFGLTFNIDSSVEERLKDLLKREDLDINNLKANTELVAEDWVISI